MSQEDIQNFLEAVRQDSSLQKKLQAEGADPVAIAKEAGFSVTQAGLIRAHASHIADLTDEELESVAGGGTPTYDVGFCLASVPVTTTACAVYNYADGVVNNPGRGDHS